MPVLRATKLQTPLDNGVSVIAFSLGQRISTRCFTARESDLSCPFCQQQLEISLVSRLQSLAAASNSPIPARSRTV
ncbi:hypothetical protein AAC387_Pa04g2320 [Persea americana]